MIRSRHSCQYFNPRAPRGARLDPQGFIDFYASISIHAPREGRDSRGDAARLTGVRISIHAPREGRD